MGNHFANPINFELPVHTVCLDDFYIGKYEVTQEQWGEGMGTEPSFNAECGGCPVEMVTSEDAQK